MSWNITEKHCLITGGTDGIGLETAKQLASKGASVTIVGRNQAKAQTAVAAIAAAAGHNRVHFRLADLSLMQAVDQLGQALLAEGAVIDVLINNVGAWFNERELTTEGLEKTLALNHLAPFVLTNRLWPSLRQREKARVVTVASGLHKLGKIHLDDLELSRGYNGLKAYNQSKLANVLFTLALAKRSRDSGVSAFSLHPGFVASSFGHNNPGLTGLAFKALQAIGAIDVTAGAATSVYCAAAAGIEGRSGGYFEKAASATASKAGQDAVMADALWQVSAQKVARLVPDLPIIG